MMQSSGGSVGFQAGGQAVDYVILVLNDKGARKLMNGKAKLGADASIAAGPVGRNAEGPQIGELRFCYAGRRDRDQPGQPVGRAQALRYPVVPGHLVEDEAALGQPHDVKSRLSLRDVERNVANTVRTVAERHADRAEWRESFRRKFGNRKRIHLDPPPEILMRWGFGENADRVEHKSCQPS
jgi:hypothetical protein